MITLQRPDPKVNALMGENKGVHDGDLICPSIFAIPFRLGKRNVVLNTSTGQCIETEYFSLFESPKNITYDGSDSEMEDLVASDYLVSCDLDETKKYLSILSVLRRMENQKPGYIGYTILPTTACNARCAYCFEAGLKYESMSDEIVEQTIRYIKATKKEDSAVSFQWFGGEPLMGEKIIDRICRAMREADINYSSSMASNGSLMTEELAAKAKEEWHLNSIQITLDGREDMYNERKNYRSFNGSPYKAVLRGIHYMLDQEIRVSIRLNVDESNLDEMMALVVELGSEFKDNSRISIYCHSIFADGNDFKDGENDKLYSGMDKLNEKLEEFNSTRKTPDKTKEGDYYDRSGAVKRYYCMVDSPTAGPVILPNGNLHLCEHIGGIPVVGTVFDEALIEHKSKVKKDRAVTEKCRRCGLLPVCTDFNECPTEIRDCYKENLAKEKSKLRALENETRIPPVNIKIDGKIIRVTEPDAKFLSKNRESIVASYLKPEETISCAEAKRKM